MDAEPSRGPPGQKSSLLSTARKRGSFLSDTEDTELYSVSGDDTSDDGFIPVQSKRAKRKIFNATPSTPASTATMKPRLERWPHVIIFVPEESGNLRLLNRQALSAYLECAVPNEIKDIRVNTRKNILAIDVIHVSALGKLQQITELGGIKVRPFIPMDDTSIAGVVYDIDVAIPNADLPTLIKPANEGIVITQVRRLGQTRCVKVIFKGDCIPSHVKVGHFRHPVRPFIQKPLQCHQCFRLGHVKGVCPNSLLCPRCAEPHAEETCRSTVLKCANCNGSHAASSKDCPRIKKERAVLKQMARDNSTHREAAEAVRRRRGRRRHRSTSKKAHARNDSAHSNAAPHSQTTKGPISSKTPADRNLSPKEWPALPNSLLAKEPQEVTRPLETSPAADDVPRAHRQVISMLRSLMGAIREVLLDMGTTPARSALKVLDALSPVLESLE